MISIQPQSKLCTARYTQRCSTIQDKIMQSPKPYRVQRPWGEFVEFTRNAPSTVKLIMVNAGESLSLQTHQERDEFWRIMSGEGTIQIGDKKQPAVVGADYFIARTIPHRISAGTSSLVVLEIAFGRADEKDIVRLEDSYGRTS